MYFYYKDGYKLIDVHEGRQYLIVPEGKEAPKGLDSDIVVIHHAGSEYLYGCYSNHVII